MKRKHVEKVGRISLLPPLAVGWDSHALPFQRVYVSRFTFYAGLMNILIKDIISTIQRILEYPVLPKSGITVGSLLLLIVLFGLVILAERP